MESTNKKARSLAALIFRFENRRCGNFLPFNEQPKILQQYYLELAAFLIRLHRHYKGTKHGN